MLFRSRANGESLLFSFPAGTKMFQFPALAPEMIRWRVFNTPGCPDVYKRQVYIIPLTRKCGRMNKESKQGRMADALALGGDEGRDLSLIHIFFIRGIYLHLSIRLKMNEQR